MKRTKPFKPADRAAFADKRGSLPNLPGLRYVDAGIVKTRKLDGCSYVPLRRDSRCSFSRDLLRGLTGDQPHTDA